MNQGEQEREVDRNYDVFMVQLPSLMTDHQDEHVLMRHGKMVSFHRSAGAALAAGRDAFADGIFSIQEVTDKPIELGSFSHAVNPGIA